MGGLTLWMLAIARLLGDKVTYWREGAPVEECSYQLLHLDTECMEGIRLAADKATVLCEERRYRDAFTALRLVRRYLEPNLLSRGGLQVFPARSALGRTTSANAQPDCGCPTEAGFTSSCILSRSQTEPGPSASLDDSSTAVGDSEPGSDADSDSADGDLLVGESAVQMNGPPGQFGNTGPP